MLLDYVEVPTSDGLSLPAGYFAPDAVHDGGPIQAVVIIPGTENSFYSGVMPHLADGFARAGYGALSLSTRGHDIAWRTAGGKRFLGAAFERVVDCQINITAAFDWLAGQGYERIALLGYSLGGAKVLYYAAHNTDSRMRALISCSGVRLSANVFAASERGDDFRRNLGRAQKLVAAGEGESLMLIDYPIGPTYFQPAGYLEKYSGEKFNLAQYAHHIRVPIFNLIGEQELDVVQMRGYAEDLMRLTVNSPHRGQAIIPQADHNYTGHERETIAAMVNWLRGLSPSAWVSCPEEVSLNRGGANVYFFGRPLASLVAFWL